MTKTEIKKQIRSSHLLEDVFEDNYEYEKYFEIACHLELGDLCPNRLEIQFDVSAKAVSLLFPEGNERTIVVKVPLTKENSTAQKKAQLREKYLKKYSSIVPQIKFELKDQLAIRRKLLTNKAEKNLINQAVRTSRQSGFRKLKNNLRKSGGTNERI